MKKMLSMLLVVAMALTFFVCAVPASADSQAKLTLVLRGGVYPDYIQPLLDKFAEENNVEEDNADK